MTDSQASDARERFDGSALEARFVRERPTHVVLRKAIVEGDLRLHDRHIEELTLSEVEVTGTLTIERMDIERLRLTDLRAKRLCFIESNVAKRAVVHLPAHTDGATPDAPAYGSTCAATEVRIERTTFTAGGVIRAATHVLSLKRATFAAPTAVLADWWKPGDELCRPRLESLVLAGVAGGTFIGWDMQRCRFYGATGLDEAVFSSCEWLHHDPGLLGRRRVIFDEVLWRQKHLPEDKWDRGLDAFEQADTTEIAGIPPRTDRDETFKAWDVESVYRDLARGARAKGLLPVAADYQWGAHVARELAKHDAAGRDRLGRLLVKLYRNIGGLGLRALRPAIVLVLVVTGLAIGLAAGGFKEGGAYCQKKPQPESRLWLCSGEPRRVDEHAASFAVAVGLITTTSRATTKDVEPWVLGVLGPLRVLVLALLGFIALALRNRVAS